MGREDWYRNTTWNPEIEAAFESKLRRARDKSQYLRIQAGILASRKPDIALQLLEKYFAIGDHFDHAQAHLDRAKAHLAKSDIVEALKSFESALDLEKSHPNLLTYAYLDLPYLIATRRLSDRYAQALEVLDAGQDRLTFPVDRYLWHGSRALILHDQGRSPEALVHAQIALEAASETQSGFRHHQQVGLVHNTDDEFGERLNVVARALH
jgi:tetratricopeptide (TPR) repeat protein